MTQTIMRMVFGSHLYGTDTPTSDTDFKSVIVPDAEDILLQRPLARGVLSQSTKVTTADGNKNRPDDVDDELFSLFKFFDMLRVGDMIASEMLFATPQSLIAFTPLWNDIIENRHRFLNRRIRGFVGYCQKQAAKYGIKGSRVAAVRNALGLIDELSKMSVLREHAKLNEFAAAIEVFAQHSEFHSIVEIDQPSGLQLKHWEVCDRKLPFTISLKEARRIMQLVMDNYGHRALLAEKNEGVDWKAMSHAVRVGEQAIELVTTGHITFPRPNAEQLKDIKAGNQPYKAVAEKLESLLQDVEHAAEKSQLPERPDERFMEQMVCDVYGATVCEYLRRE